MGEVMIVEIDAGTIDFQWKKISEILKPAVEYNGTLNLLNVYELVKSGLAKLFVAVKEKQIFAAFLVERVKGINKNYLRVVLAAGEPMKEWIGPLIKLMDGLSAAENVEFYEMIGRPGWKRALKDIGYESAMVYRRNI